MEPRTNGPSWIKEFSGAITIADRRGIILAMNDKAGEMFAAEGGAALIGTNVLDCHPEPARAKLRAIMEERRTNVYTIEKKGVKKLVYQAPWTVAGEYRGTIELVLEIPFDLPHFIRK
jgi:transcriptional regulator with PAS, ATPase and Fis domain